MWLLFMLASIASIQGPETIKGTDSLLVKLYQEAQKYFGHPRVDFENNIF